MLNKNLPFKRKDECGVSKIFIQIKTMKKLLISGLMIFGFFSLSAGSVHPVKVTKTQVIQQKRIKQGVQSGEITKREFIKLEKQQARIQRTKKIAKADGIVTCKERHKLKSMQKNASVQIYKQKHDLQSRY